LEEVGEDAYVILQVKYGLIRLINTRAELCDQVSNVDMTCPIEKGKITITKDVELPKEIPPVSVARTVLQTTTNSDVQGKYNVFADVYTAEDNHIVCLEATVTFT
jgi:hypothetical protein